jgi:hypothetical protein
MGRKNTEDKKKERTKKEIKTTKKKAIKKNQTRSQCYTENYFFL